MGKILVYGVGINDASYNVSLKEELPRVNGERRQKHVWTCPYYVTWKGMLQRCYSDAWHIKYPTYEGCTVCDEWLTFSNFRRWMETQDWEGNQLDKDILFIGNKIYSPEMCVFVSGAVNKFITESNSSRGDYPIGVSWNNNESKFVSRCCQFSGKRETLGYFNTPEEAHKAWLKEKLRLAKILAREQKDERIAKALIDRYENYKGI